MIGFLTSRLPLVTPILFALGLGLGLASGPAHAAAPSEPAAAEAALRQAAGLAGAELAPAQPPELWQCKLGCLAKGRTELRACLAEEGATVRACIDRAKAVVEACVADECADIEPPCPIVCLRSAHAAYQACIADGGTRQDCAAAQREALRACLEACP